MCPSRDEAINTPDCASTASANSNYVLNDKDNHHSLYSNASSHSSYEKLDSNILTSTDNTSELNLKAKSSPDAVSLNVPHIKSGKILRPNTSVTSTVKDRKGNVVKRKYSRNGCTECKRRRMKCDETKPTCWQCSRLNRDCIYLNLVNNKKKSEPLTQSTRSSQIDESALAKKLELQKDEHIDDINDENFSLEHPSMPSQNNITDNVSNHDANLLIQNLNDIVNMKLNNSFIIADDLKDVQFDLSIPDLGYQEASVNSIPISFHPNRKITFNMELSSLKLGGIHEKYLKAFYYDCMDSIAPFFQKQENPLRDILLSFAKTESYLLSSILAIGASILHRKTDDLEDEKNYCQYLSHCLKFLDEEFQNESNVIDKIEPIILTVIILAWDCIYTMNCQWRSHLKGIIDLFKKINLGNSSKILNVAKSWFKIMETFAGISTTFGGSLTDDYDIDLIFNPYDYEYIESLKYLEIMTPINEFNLLRGHKEDFDIVIKEVLKSLKKVREYNEYKEKTIENVNGTEGKALDVGELSNLPKSFQRTIKTPESQGKFSLEQPVSYFTIQKLLVEVDKQLDYEFINKTGIIPCDSQSHPNISQLQDNAIDVVVLRNGEEIAISWYDISHQTQVLSFLLIILLKLLDLPKTSPMIQEVVKKIMSFFKFLNSDDPPQNLRTCYSNFAVLVAGLNAVDEETKDSVREYYRVNSGKFSRLSQHNLKRLEEIWSGNSTETEQDVLTW